ncbi:MAG: AAA family ATPase, partial [Nitrospirota bacterium]
PNHEEALHRLLYGIEARKGAVILTGEIGCGKTLLSRTLIHHLLREKYDTALIADPTFEEAQLLREVLYQLGIEATGSELELRHRLNERLMDNMNRGLDTVLIIDEAQVIHEDQMFEKLRLMLNFQLNDRFLLTLVLLGQPELRTRFQRLNQFYQRVAIRYHLGPFTEAEVANYIRFRLAVAGCKREIFTPDACSLIFQASDGIPRRVNTLCDLCLLLGSLEKTAVIDRKMVGRVAVKVTHGIGQDHRITQPVPTFRSHQVALPT